MSSIKKGLKAVAILEAFKGITSLFIGVCIHELAGKNIQKVLGSLMSQFHLNPTSYWSGIILYKASFLNSANLTLITIGTIAYAIIRLVESYGLWNALIWTEWFALISGAIYLPFEIYEVIMHTGVLSILVLTINIAVVWYMYTLLKAKPNLV